MNAPFALTLPLAFPPGSRDQARERPDWLTVYREAEAAAELAAEGVRAACEAYRADRCPETEAAYRAADRAYDRARYHFQTTSCELVKGIRAIASFARAVQLADAQKERML